MEETNKEEFKKELKDLLKKHHFKSEGIKNVRIHLEPEFLVTVDTE